MTHGNPTHEAAKIEHAAKLIRESTSLLQHEFDALKKTNVLGEHNIDNLFLLLGKVDVFNTKLHRQLVQWHTQFPQKPTLHESDQFWRELKDLRSTKEQLDFLLESINQHEEEINTLKTQLSRTKDTIDSVEEYFDGYLNRVNKGE